MVERRRNGARRATGPLLSVSVLLVGLVATVLTATALLSAQRDTARRVMDKRHETAREAIRAETERYHRLVETLAAGIANDAELTWEDFDGATSPLVDAKLIGAAPLAFVVPVRTEDLAAAQRLWRERGALGVTFRPDPNLDEHYFSVFVRLLDEAEQGVRSGSDVAAEEPLATTLATARDTHQATVSDAYVLMRDRQKPAAEQQQSFVFAAPVWTRENMSEFRGWVVSGLRGRTFLQDILGKAGEGQISGDLVSVNSDGIRATVASWAGPGEADLHRSDPIQVADREWILETHGDSRHLAGTGWYLPVIALAGGLVLTALLAWLVHVLATSRARAHARVEQATAELREAEAESRRQADLLGAIMTTISDGVSVVDSRGSVLLENPAAKRLLGLNEVPNAPEDWQQHFGVYRPDGRTPLPLEEMPLIRALNGESTDGVEVVIRNAGQPKGVLLSIDGRPLDPSAGEHGAVAVCRDITELRRYETDLSIFAGVVAHDLKAPLASVRGHAELVMEDLPETAPEMADARDGLRRIVRAVDRMDMLIETMLAYTTARHAPLRAVTVHPAPLVREIIEDRIAGLGADGPAPEWSIEPLPPVRADPAMLRHVLDNLIGNALKYVRPGATPRVEVVAGPAGPGQVRIEVADGGIGIPDADKPHVFESFHRTEAAAGYAGTGLGLTICQRIVQRHGGEIGVADNPGGGTRFWFTLPAAASVKEPAMTSADGSPAESDDAVREALERALAERAAMVEAARLPGLAMPPGAVPAVEPAPGRLRAPVPERQHRD
ncbi:ATP-binding protein [Actinoplanes sp. NEAU-A12]|uniref:Sensor-like histidine kinase SenX3 n=1 Tax=Actinoplanes sandaracinus TaxID=3045177 RepID=A0ABT6WN85_9ACTN|nr:ATP-binding protein [Actinoplanes sandaracinus]MDI6101155.1 ATP-binding protein [Actinoplanes sandaracinus]